MIDAADSAREVRAHCRAAFARRTRAALTAVAWWALSASVPSLGFADPRAQLRAVSGPVVLARAGTTDVFLWDATTYVTQLVADKVFGDGALRALEASAVSALSANVAAGMGATVSLRVVYLRSGAVSPAYGGATFAGVENVLTLSAARSDLSKHAGEWERQLLDGTVPAAMKITVAGNLPSS